MKSFSFGTMEETEGIPIARPPDEGQRTMVGRTVAHYRVAERIGKGGMSVVYRAEDIDLGRSVAIKFISSRLTTDEAAKQRFTQEARAASALDHQNICTIHQIGEYEGRLYLVMGHYGGQTLGQKLRRGSVTVDQALNIAYQVASGLSRAHEEGIVHRDVKPGNLMITERDEVKILDFGIAKLARSQPGLDALTQTGMVLGTAAYMSPEQASGQEVNEQTDIWATGVVLFEMLTGQKPFQGPHPAKVIHSILYDLPDDSLLPSQLSPAVKRILGRALAKELGHRYGRMKDLQADLALAMNEGTVDPTAGLPATQAFPNVNRSIVVLPFENLSADRDSDYFSDGLTDEVITDLSNIRALRVISRTSTNRLKASTDDLRTIARSLNVQYVLEGGVRRAGDSLRVTAKLIDATTESLLWAEKYSGTLEDVFAIQESLSRKIVEALRVTLSVEEDRKLSEQPISDVEAYEFYLRGKQEGHRYTEEALDRALAYLQSGLAIDETNPLLVATLGHVYFTFVNAGISSDPIYLQKAEECAKRSFELEPEFSHGSRLLGVIRILQGKTLEGVELLRSSLRASPNDTDALAYLASCYGVMGRIEAAETLVRRLLEIDPLTPAYRCWPGILSLMKGEFEAAVAPFATSVRMDPSQPMVRCLYGQAVALAGDRERATEIFEGLSQSMPESFFAYMAQLYLHAFRGESAEGARIVQEELKPIASVSAFYSWNLSEGLSLLGEHDLALEWLDQALANGFMNYTLIGEKDPFLESLRGDERFDDLVGRMREAWGNFEL
ncbi:MAG: protein kinase [Acidobacteriota bacterium]